MVLWFLETYTLLQLSLERYINNPANEWSLDFHKIILKYGDRENIERSVLKGLAKVLRLPTLEILNDSKQLKDFRARRKLDYDALIACLKENDMLGHKCFMNSDMRALAEKLILEYAASEQATSCGPATPEKDYGISSLRYAGEDYQKSKLLLLQDSRIIKNPGKQEWLDSELLFVTK